MRGTEQVEERIWGTKGTMIMNENGILFYSTRSIDGRRPGKLHQIKKLKSTSWTADWIRNFAIAVREGREPDISCREAWENLAFITSAYESLEAQKPVAVPQYNDGNRADGKKDKRA
jgi:predicted dehydrogenase